MMAHANGKAVGTTGRWVRFAAAALAFGVCGGWLARPVYAGRGQVLEQAAKGAKWVAQKVVREGGEEVAERAAAREVAQLATRFGDDAARLVSEAGEVGLQVARRAEFGTKVLPLARRFGPEVVKLEARSPGLGRVVFETFGESAARFAPKLSETSLIRATRLARKGGAEAARKLGEVLERFGEKGLEAVERILRASHNHWKGAAVVGAVTYVLAHPDEVADVPGDMLQRVLDSAGGPAFLTMILVAVLGRCFIREWFRDRRAAREAVR